MATQSRARHFHATAKALSQVAASRDTADSLLSTGGESGNLDISAIVAEANAGAAGIGETIEIPFASVELAAADISSDELRTRHEEFRWADSKLMQASERLAEAQEARRKDLVALALMRRELQGSFSAERGWLAGAQQFFASVSPALAQRELELHELVEDGVRTAAVIHELASVRAERKLFELAALQTTAQFARIEEQEALMDYQVAAEAYDREPDGASMREVARLRSLSTRTKREATAQHQLRTDAYAALGIDTRHGEVTAANAFLAAEYEGDVRSAERMDRVRIAQSERELGLLPEPEAAWKAGLKHPVRFMQARKSAPANR